MLSKYHLSEDELFDLFFWSLNDLYGPTCKRQSQKIMREKYKFYVSQHKELVSEFKEIYKEIKYCMTKAYTYPAQAQDFDNRRFFLLKELRRLFDEERSKY